ncbi:hypothetical protein JOD57_000308 [Geodermatophilus bullaregiensis]|nr:hypothetical protein [Geodermatophilus bullaregiensis]MBM7804471.1 hypothetical protein [Geodermatophilus bullaregiensis]
MPHHPRPQVRRHAYEPAPDALPVLRGYAYAAGRAADDVAIALVERP